MGFLDRPVSELSLGELQRLIRQEVGHQIPPIPAWVANLSDLDKPLIPPDVATNAFTLVYSTAQGKYIDSKLPSSSTGTDAAAPGQPVVTLISGPGWLQARWAAVTGSADPIQYKVYVRAGSAPTTADATYLVGTTTALSFVISKLADGTTATTDTVTYHVIVKPVSSLTGGATGTDSTDVTGSPAVLDGSVFTISNINAGNITTGTLAVGGTVTVTGTITGATFQTGSADPRVILDSTGLYANDASGTQVFKVNALTGTFSGSVILDTAAGMLLVGGVSEPITQPSLSVTNGGSLTGSTTYYVTYSWYDGVSHETAFYTVVPHIATTGTSKTLSIVIPAAPAGATNCRIYMDTATFTQGAGHLQSSPAVSTSAPTTVTISSFAGAGAASPTPVTIAQQGVFGTTATLQPENAIDSSGARYGWTIEGNGRIRFLGATLNSQFWVYDEFLGGGTTIGVPWATGVTLSGAVSDGTASSSNPGVINIATGTTAGARATLATNPMIGLGVGKTRYSVYFCCRTGVPNGTNNYQIGLGLSTTNDPVAMSSSGAGVGVIAFTFSGTTNPANASFGLRCTGSAATTFFQAVDAAGSNVALTVGAFVFAEFQVNAAGTTVDWWVNNVKQTQITVAGTVAANSFPVVGGSATLLRVTQSIIKTAAALTRSIDVDAVGLYGDYVS